MRYLTILACLAVLLGCGSNDSPKPEPNPGPKTAENLKPIEGLSQYALGTPVAYGNVSLVPVVLTSEKSPQDTGEYTSLAEAKKLGEVEINEMPSGKEVNRLTVKNLGKKPLLLLAGELLLGGQQDRVVAKDTVVPPGSEMAVPVFCVEHGRWEGKSDKFEFSGTMAPQAVREKANFGDQQEVWDKVSDYNKAAAPSLAEGGTSVRGGQFDKTVQTRVEGDLSKFIDGLDKQRNVVGLVYLVNGDIQSFELFGNEALLKASREPLIKGFLADAAIRNFATGPTQDMGAVARFVQSSLSGERQQTRLASGAANWKVQSGLGLQGVETTLPTAEAGKAGSTAGLLHGSYAPAAPGGR